MQTTVTINEQGFFPSFRNNITAQDILDHNPVLKDMIKNHASFTLPVQISALPNFLAEMFNYINSQESYKNPRHNLYRHFLNDINIERHCRTVVGEEVREILAGALVGSPTMQSQERTEDWTYEDYLSFFQKGFVSTYKFTHLMPSKYDSTRIAALTKVQVLQSLYILMASRLDTVVEHCSRDWRNDQQDLYHIVCPLPSILFRDGLGHQFGMIRDAVYFSGMSKRQIIKPVKFLRAAFPALTEKQAALVGQTVADMFRQEFLKSIEAVKVSNIPSLIYTGNYTSSLRSCMKNKDEEMFELYDDLPNTRIAYITDGDEDGCIIARALLHDEVRNEDTGEIIKVMDRIYAEDGDCEAMMINYAKAHGYYRKIRQALNVDRYVAPDMKPGDDYVDLPNMSIAAPHCKPNTYSLVPYIDTFNEYSTATPERLYTSLTDEQRSGSRCFVLCNEDGEVERFTTKTEKCIHCRCTIDVNDPESYFLTEDNDYVCNDCIEDKYFQCDCCDQQFCKDDTSMHNTPDGDTLCDSCFNDKWCECNTCNEIISRDDANFVSVTNDHDECYCKDCYDSLVEDKEIVETISGNVAYVNDVEKINEGTDDEGYETLLNFSKMNIRFCETCLRFFTREYFTREYMSMDDDSRWTCCHCQKSEEQKSEEQKNEEQGN